MTRRMLSEQVADRLGISRRRADRILVEMFATIVRRLSERESVKLKTFGKFEVRLRKGRSGRHPATGRRISIGNRYVVRFSPARRMKNLPSN